MTDTQRKAALRLEDARRKQAKLLIDAIPNSPKLDMRGLIELTRVLGWDQATTNYVLGTGGMVGRSTKAPAVLALCENRLRGIDGNSVQIDDGSGTTVFTFADERFMQIVAALDKRRQNLAIGWQ
ncbi:MAG: hypothetical protein ABH810_01825 [bacterium]